MKHGGGGASGVGVGVGVGAPVPASRSRLCHAGEALGRGGPSVDGSGWGWRAGGSWESDILVPGPVVRRGLPVGLLREFVHLRQRNKRCQ